MKRNPSVLIMGGLLAAAAFAQDSGAVLGKVTDPSGAIVADAQIELTNTGTNVSQRTASNAAGDFLFTPVRAGSYSIRVARDGFRTLVDRKSVV